MASKTSRILTKEAIFAADDLQELEVEVPQWGGTVRVRSLSLEQVAKIRQHAIPRGKTEPDERLQVAGLLCEGIIEPEFDFAEAQQLLGKNTAAVQPILAAINKISGISAEAVVEAEKSANGRPDAPLPLRTRARVKDDASAVATRDVDG